MHASGGCGFQSWVQSAIVMVLYKYFSVIPHPGGPLSSTVPPSALASARVAVKPLLDAGIKNTSVVGSYLSYMKEKSQDCEKSNKNGSH